MNFKILTVGASAAFLVGAGHVSAAVITIDSFDTPQAVADEPFGVAQPQGSEVKAPDAIGGWRDLYVETDDEGNLSATTLEVRDSNLSFSNEDNVTGRGWVTYDGYDDDPFGVNKTGLGGIDLFTGPLGTPGFLFEVVRLDLPFVVTVRAWDMFGETTEFSSTVSSTGTPFLPFAAFSNEAFDFNEVGALQFFADSGDTTINVDAAIGSISVDTGVVPLPAPALLLLGGLGGFGGLAAFGKRRRKRT
ncbi:hypothetical protein JSE7799_00544 [Jannaschia seosinensis]|uniref:VPLPA-CTERM protein sorting domain protein n=1 Tax=Jannaschia seosinensis TaxID=313367 RepID=A0A0M7B936_9RHOB|nr:hypothetical protein [Jannaschia seosinensis]CUH21209.1 hypothetical protein JSE7799_00544 [Jannaschia seosinensis]